MEPNWTNTEALIKQQCPASPQGQGPRQSQAWGMDTDPLSTPNLGWTCFRPGVSDTPPASVTRATIDLSHLVPQGDLDPMSLSPWAVLSLLCLPRGCQHDTVRPPYSQPGAVLSGLDASTRNVQDKLHVKLKTPS